MTNIKQWSDIRPTAELAREYRELGLWRDETPAADLRRWAHQTPDAVAITARRAATGIQRLTYREYADRVDRVTAVLARLGISPGQVVAVQLPNWWQMNAVVLACARLGAVVAPLTTGVRAGQLEWMLEWLEPAAYVTTDVWDGYDHSAAFASIAERLPGLKHRIIVGDRVGPGEIDLTEAAERVDADEFLMDDSAEDPDRVSIILFTSGTTGRPKAVLHSFNTFYAASLAISEVRKLTSSDVEFTPHSLAHGVGLLAGNMLPLRLGGHPLITDTWNPDEALDLLVEDGATALSGAPVFLNAIAQAARSRALRPPRLREVVAGATAIPSSLVEAVRDNLGVIVRGGWGMTEVPGPTLTSPDQDPLDWATRSVGRPHRALEIDMRADGEVSVNSPARMFVRGACVCLAVTSLDADEVNLVAEDGDGWYDTGDLVVPDGRGGIRLVDRAADRIGAVLMIPTAEVEDALRRHPDITDAALIGYGPGNQLPCAVVLSPMTLTLEDVRAYLDGIEMTDWYQPQRLEHIEALPRNPTGKVDKYRLRAWLRTLDEV